MAAHLIAVALITAIGGFDMPYLAGWMRWAYAFALCGFGTLPWLAMDVFRLRVRLARENIQPGSLNAHPDASSDASRPQGEADSRR